MALPKSRHSKARTRKRRANWKFSAPSIELCPNCQEFKVTHVACRACGYYNGRKVIEVKKKAKT
jgi:large subunit ribosomal protein L32